MRLCSCCLHADNALHNQHPIGETHMLYGHASCLCKSHAMQRRKILYVLSMIPPSINCSALMYSWLGDQPLCSAIKSMFCIPCCKVLKGWKP